MFGKRVITLIGGLCGAALLLTACKTPTPEVVEIVKEVVQTVVVTEEIIVAGTPVVKETIKEVVVTATPAQTQSPEPTEVVYDRAETLYVSGSAWGAASTWNPFQPGNLANATGTIGNVYEFLFAFNSQTDELTPWLAESGAWSSDTTYDVTLRQGVTWSDGAALTAQDVVFTFELGKQYTALWFSPVWAYLTGVTAVDDYTLHFTFEASLYQEWANYLYNLPIVPEHLWAGRSAEEITVGANHSPVGSGAYLYETHSEDRNVWLRNENWWGKAVFGLPAPQRIVDIHFSSNNIALGSILRGDVDLSNNFLPGVAALSHQGYVQTYFAEAPYMLSANTAVLFLNTTKPPMNDPAFRKALAYAINVDDIVNVAYAQLVRPASPTGLLPTLSKYDDQAVLAELAWAYDPAKAVAILEGAGYTKGADGFYQTPTGSPIALQVTCPSGWTDWMAAIDVIAASAQEVGLNVQAVTFDYGVWNAALQGGTFDMTLNNWTTMSNTPWTLYNLLFHHPLQEQMQNGNFGRYVDQEMFDLVDALAKVPVTDEAGMKAACSAIQRKLLTEVPVIPLWHNGLWAQYSNAVWTNWPAETSADGRLPTTWSGYWQMGGLQTLINLEPRPTE